MNNNNSKKNIDINTFSNNNKNTENMLKLNKNKKVKKFISFQNKSLNKKRKRENEKDEDLSKDKDSNKSKNINIDEEILKDKDSDKAKNSNIDEEKNELIKSKKDKDIIFIDSNIIFNYINQYNIDSAYAYNNGDILIFLKNYSILFENKTFNQILKLDFIGSINCFCYLSEEEFIHFKNNYFEIYKFENKRSSVKLINTVLCENINKITMLSNKDLAILSFSKFNFIIKIYKKDEKSKEYTYIKTLNEIINDFIEINSNEVLTIKKNESDNKIIFRIFENKSYNYIKTNSIKLILGKLIIYISTPLYKSDNNKFFGIGNNNLYIFSAKTLEIESVIVLGIYTDKILYLDEGYYLFNYKKIIEQKEKIFVKKLKIDFKYNEIIEEIDQEITEYCGKYMTLFKLEKYIDNGIIAIFNNSLLKIYK